MDGFRYYRRNIDDRVRKAQRAYEGEPSYSNAINLVVARLRAGEIPLLFVEAAASLGHPIAIEILQGEIDPITGAPLGLPIDWEDRDARIHFFGGFYTEYGRQPQFPAPPDYRYLPMLVQIVAGIAEKAVRDCWTCSDNRPQLVIVAAKTWAADPTETHRAVTLETASAAHDAANVNPTPSRWAAFAATQLGYAVASQISFKFHAANSVECAQRAVTVSEHGHILGPSWEWQREHISNYLLGLRVD